MARWKDEQFPAIRAAGKAGGATIYVADEAGVRSDYHAGTTWAPVGHTPVVNVTGARHSLHMISAVTAHGLLRFPPTPAVSPPPGSSSFATSSSTTPTARSI